MLPVLADCLLVVVCEVAYCEPTWNNGSAWCCVGMLTNVVVQGMPALVGFNALNFLNKLSQLRSVTDSWLSLQLFLFSLPTNHCQLLCDRIWYNDLFYHVLERWWKSASYTITTTSTTTTTTITTTTTTTTTTILQPLGLCPRQLGWASTRRNIHPLTPVGIYSK